MTSSAESDGRTEQRTNMFVMASMVADAGPCPVRMRNLSSHGALVEGAVLPRSGSRFRLCRGNLTIQGQVVWSDGVRAGLRFNSVATVADWLPRAQQSNGQQRVDEIILQMKAGGRASISERGTAGPGDDPSITASELNSLKAALESLAEDLAEDEGIVQRFAAKLQALDIAAQMLGKLARSR